MAQWQPLPPAGGDAKTVENPSSPCLARRNRRPFDHPLFDVFDFGGDRDRFAKAASHGAVVGMESVHPLDRWVIFLGYTLEPVRNMNSADDEHPAVHLDLTHTR
jgi:hypothetical protein